MRKYFLLCFFVSLSLHVPACDCTTQTVTKEATDKYDLIFVGKVVAVSGCSDEAKVKFMITSLFKGKAFQSSELEFDCQSDCAMSFAPDDEWIVYANYVSYGVGKIQLCSLSRLKAKEGTTDSYSTEHGMSYSEELDFLRKTYGVQEFNVAKVEDQQHHELLHPTPWQTVLLLIASLAGLILFYYLVKKFLK